jgi:hypothetical protein
MHLFGDSSGPHLAHFHARREHDSVEVFWEVLNAPSLHWRVLRSEADYAATADALPGSGQTLVMEGTETHLKDDQLVPGTHYFYTVFAQDEQGAWHEQVRTKLAHGDRLRWLHDSLNKWPHETGADDETYEQIKIPGETLLLQSQLSPLRRESLPPR